MDLPTTSEITVDQEFTLGLHSKSAGTAVIVHFDSTLEEIQDAVTENCASHVVVSYERFDMKHMDALLFSASILVDSGIMVTIQVPASESVAIQDIDGNTNKLMWQLVIPVFFELDNVQVVVDNVVSGKRFAVPITVMTRNIYAEKPEVVASPVTSSSEEETDDDDFEHFADGDE